MAAAKSAWSSTRSTRNGADADPDRRVGEGRTSFDIRNPGERGVNSWQSFHAPEVARSVKTGRV